MKKAFKHSSAIKDFTVRGQHGTRIEALSDGIFSLAIALLLISSTIPSNYGELERFMYDFFPFACCMIYIYWIWKAQCIFFLRFGINDSYTEVLNLALLFFVLFYVYPLKFLMSFLLRYFYILISALFDPEWIGKMRSYTFATFSNIEVQMPRLMLIYGLGFFSIFAILFLLYRHALKLREDLELSPIETLETESTLRQYLSIVYVTIISIVLAIAGWITLHPIFAFLSGMSYNLIWIFKIGIIKKFNKAIEEIREN